MIYGTGVDLVQVERIEKVIERWGDRFINRVFTKEERKFCLKRTSPASAFSLRFAAKEAFSKAIGTGMRKGVFWRDIEVFHFPGGRPGLKVHGHSEEICKREKICGLHLSLSDEGVYGIAMVVLEKQT
jgi:holo-[acyl-carrier protein] synthase